MKEYNISIKRIESAIADILLISPIDISTEKIKLLCMNNNTSININKQDDIYINSKNMLDLYGQLLNKDENFSKDKAVL